MNVKELKNLIKNLNDEVLIHIATPFHLGTEVTAKKYSNFGRDSKEEECIWLCFMSEDAKTLTGVEQYISK
jgi:hypothetical protein